MKNSGFGVDVSSRALVNRNDGGAGEAHEEGRGPGRVSLGALLPENGRLASLLGMDSAALEDLLQATLLHPLAELSLNGGKRIRGQLVALGCRLVSEERSIVADEQCRSCADMIELIHAGSLIIDDIEDGSRMRRGRPALHVRFGVPIALNAGNWLYFWPLELLRQIDITRDKKFYLYEHCHRTMLRAHFGQAVDLGARVDTLPQNRVSAAALASMKLKTGALMGFASLLGGVVGGASEPLLAVLDEFGCSLGVALQMFDDLGNVVGKCEPSKRYEDLRLYRPSWVWACAANRSSADEYARFTAAAGRLPDCRDLEIWIEEHELVPLARRIAQQHLEAALQNLEKRLDGVTTHWSKRALRELRELGEEITRAYG